MSPETPSQPTLSKAGTRIQTFVQFSEAPLRPFGQVTWEDQGANGYTLAVQWGLPAQARALVDWFTRDEYDRFLRDL